MFQRARYLLLAVALTVPAAPVAYGQDGPQNLGEVNTPADETDPFALADGRNLFYSSAASGTYDLMLAQRQGRALTWGMGIAVPMFNTDTADERTPRLTADKQFFFATNRVPDPAFKDLKNWDIYSSEERRAAQPLLRINTREDEQAPWLTRGGREVYFSRKAADGWRICVTTGPAAGGIGAGEVIEAIPAGFQHPTLTPDGSKMFLEGKAADGRSAIFVSNRSGNSWSAPKAITNLAHAEGQVGDTSPSLSSSGQTLFFASDRPGGQGGLDLWLIPVAELKVAE